MLKMLRLAAVAALIAHLAGSATAEMRLLMFEQAGCVYCAEWDHEISEIYPLTPEGKAAPLERVQLRGPYPSGIDLAAPPVFTPTFILLRDGTETGRIEGYPGEDFFWGLLGRMLAETGEFTPAVLTPAVSAAAGG